MATSIDKNTAKLMIKKLQSQLDDLFAEQQEMNGNSIGIQKAQFGTKIPGGYTNEGNYSLGQMFKDPYKIDFNRPAFNTGNPVWYQNFTNVAAANKVLPKTTTGNASGIVIPNYTAPLTVDPNKLMQDAPFSSPSDSSVSPVSLDKKLNWGKVGTFAAQAAPMIYNMFKGLQRTDRVRPMYNPYENEIRSAMRNRRFDVNPTLNANLTAQAVNNRNVRSAANSRGELMSNLGASQNARMAADAAAFAQGNNMNNIYLGQQAEMDQQLGASRANMDWMTQDYNARNRAATNNFMGQAFNDLGMFGQTQQLMKNQQLRDAQLAGLIPDMFQVYNFMPGMQDILNTFKNGQ